MKHLQLYESDLSKYAIKEFGMEKVMPTQKVGFLFHGTEISRALSILKDGSINNSNYAYDKGHFKWEPFFKHPNRLDDLYGHFVYLSKSSNGFFGVGDCDVLFCVNGNQLIKTTPIYRSKNKKIEGYLFMAENKVPLDCVTKIYCWDEDQMKLMKGLTQIPIILM